MGVSSVGSELWPVHGTSPGYSNETGIVCGWGHPVPET